MYFVFNVSCRHYWLCWIFVVADCKLFALLMLLVMIQYAWTVTFFVIMSLSNQWYAICNCYKCKTVFREIPRRSTCIQSKESPTSRCKDSEAWQECPEGLWAILSISLNWLAFYYQLMISTVSQKMDPLYSCISNTLWN